MSCSITLTAADRNTLLDHYRSNPDPQLRLRAHLLLLLADGYTWALIAAVLYCSTATLARWQQRFRDGGVESLLGLPSGVFAPWTSTSTPTSAACGCGAGDRPKW